MSALYKHMARYYDRIFLHNYGVQADFIGRYLPDSASSFILEFGCGTGGLAAALSGRGYPVLATDICEDMVAAAKKHEQDHPLLSFEIKDMTTCVADFTGVEFQGVLCLGNTMVHVKDMDQAASLCRDFFKLTAPGGVTIIQILNYERVVAGNNVTAENELFPVLGDSEVRFSRSYEPGQKEGTLQFITNLRIEEGSQINDFTDRTDHLILRRDDLQQMLIESGFSKVSWFGSFAGESFDPQGMVAIAVAEKSR